MGYQPGDAIVCIQGHTYHFRLTLGALAEISVALCANSPQALARRIKEKNCADTLAIVKACARPVHGEIHICAEQARDAFMHLAPIFEQAFTLTDGEG